MTEKRVFQRLQDRDLGRTEGFSDGIFAIAITLLVLSLDIPVDIVEDVDRELLRALRGMRHEIFAFLLSFFIVGMFWIEHHKITSYMKKQDIGFLTFNLFFLLFIVALPFSTLVLSDYGDSITAIALYSINMMAVSLAFSALLYYVGIAKNLEEKTLTRDYFMEDIFCYISITCIFLISIFVAIYSTTIAKFLWILIWPSNMIIGYIFKKLAEEDYYNGSD